MSAQEAIDRGLADEIMTQADETAPEWAGVTITNAAGGSSAQALMDRYAQLVRSGAREADPSHPVAALPQTSTPTAQGAEENMGWQAKGLLAMENLRFAGGM